MSHLHRIEVEPSRIRGSVVFVHGLGGDPYATWGGKGEDDRNYWLHWLAADLPDLAFYSLSYAASPTTYRGSALSLMDRGLNISQLLLTEPALRKAPIAFICHSLGGLVVKQFIRHANEQKETHPELGQLLDRVAQVVFIATPHSGSKLPRDMHRWSWVTRPTVIIEDLKNGGDALENLRQWYTDFCATRAIDHLVFHETKKMYGRWVVDKTSSNASIACPFIAIDDRDHVDICKRVGRHDLLYNSIKQLLEGLPYAKPGPAAGDDVYVSFAEDNVEVAHGLRERLEQRGFTVSLDIDRALGWRRLLERSHHAARKVIVLWSRASCRNELVLREAELALRHNKLVAYRIESCAPRKPFHNPSPPILTDPDALLVRVVADLGSEVVSTTDRPFAVRVETSSLPRPSSDVIVGRDRELAILHTSWSGQKTRVVAIRAMGGEGKTALIHRFLLSLANKQWDGAAEVFGWSAEEQGSASDGHASADALFYGSPERAGAFTWFGFDPTGVRFDSEAAKGVKLANLVRERRSLVILDGLEMLQNLPNVHNGAFTDRSIASLVTSLTEANPGLLILASRQQIHELPQGAEPGVIHLPLGRLDEDSGIELLRSRGVVGSQAEMKKAIAFVDGHALSLNLLANWLLTDERADSDIKEWRRALDTVWSDDDPAAELGVRSAWKVMAAYVDRLSKLARSGSRGKGGPELDYLSIIGLFDRPAEADAIDALLEGDPIAGVTDALCAHPGMKGYALRRLRSLGLLLPLSRHRPGELDAHPLVRSYFARRVKRLSADGFKEANRRLYNHYCSGKEFPVTLDEMEPLLRAIKHGCAAGLHQEAFDDVLRRRLLRGDAYLVIELGAVSTFREALRPFFSRPWTEPVATMRIDQIENPLYYAGFALRSLGQLDEAVAPWSADLENALAQRRWGDANVLASQLGELYVMLGRIDRGQALCQEAVGYARLQGVEKPLLMSLAKLADAQHQHGDFAAAMGSFKEAEELQAKLAAETEDEFHLLNSVRGFRYCDLLLSLGRHAEVIERATQTLAWAKRKASEPLAIALDRLTLGKALHQHACAVQTTQGSAQNCISAARLEVSHCADDAAEYLDIAVAEIQRVQAYHYLPLALLARASLMRDLGDLAAAREDLQLVRSIADPAHFLEHPTKKPMPTTLLFIDYLLETMRLSSVSGNDCEPAQIEKLRTFAAAAIALTGYHRRHRELNALGPPMRQ